MSDGVANLVNIMNYKLVLKEDQTEPYIFYKDEGKKDKCINITVQLYDEFDCLVRTRIIPLKLTLLYSNGLICPTQDILSLSPDSRLSIDTTGSTLLRVRINAVSKGHQSQMFKIQVSEDTGGDPNKLSYITPVYSVPVEVRSKRNNLKRKVDVAMSDGMSDVGGTNKYIAEGFVNYSGNSSSNTNDAAVMSDLEQHRWASHGYPSGTTGYIRPPVYPTTNRNAVSTTSMPFHTMSPPVSDTAATLMTERPSESSFAPSVNRTMPSIAPAAKANDKLPPCTSGGYVAPMALDSAVGNVLRWAGVVMTGLQEIQWKHIGYERFPDGCIDNTRPLYAMSNPGPVITDIINQYSNETMSSLQYLVKEADAYRQQAFKDAMVMFTQSEVTEPSTSDPTTDTTPSQVSSTTHVMMSSASSSSTLAPASSPQTAVETTLTQDTPKTTTAATDRQRTGGDATKVSTSSAALRDHLDFNKSLIMHDQRGLIETFDWSNSNTEMLLGITVNSDKRVHYIIGHVFTVKEGSMGIPAYDVTKQLIGFYRESTNANRNIVLKYRSVNAHRGIPLDTKYVEAAKRELVELLQENSPKVFTLSKCGDDLEKMKQDALIFSWMHEGTKEVELPGVEEASNHNMAV